MDYCTCNVAEYDSEEILAKKCINDSDGCFKPIPHEELIKYDKSGDKIK